MEYVAQYLRVAFAQGHNAEALEEPEEDPVIGRFLDFVARDLSNHPERLRQLDTNFVHRAQALVHGVEVDLDQPLSADDE